ncbi:MAG: polyprenyl synthetase family protein [Methanobacteriota archaeon]|nr:MAG: polyprenyl synthetase family protein [Euryarchaeota archaeon]
MEADRLESLIAPYRERSNAEIRAQLDAYLSAHPPSRYPSSRTLRSNARTLFAGKRYRFALAVAGYEGLSGVSAGPGVVRASTWLEWYHVYTLFLDDIMDEDVRRRTFPSAWSTDSRLYRGRDAETPGIVFRNQRIRYGASQAILDALRIRSLAERAIEGAEGLNADVRERLLEELTEVDLVLSDGQGLDIDFETAARVREADYEAMSDRKTGRLYVGAAATAAILAGTNADARAALETYARHFSIAFQDRDDLLGAGVVASRIGGSSSGDIKNGKRTRLFSMAVERIPRRERTAFLRAYGRGPRTTPKDIALVRRLLREHVLGAMRTRIKSNVASALAALGDMPFRDRRPNDLLALLARAQTVRVA